MLGKGPVLIVDGAHNPPAAKALRRSLLKLSGRKKVILVLGMLSYKDHKNIARELAPVSKLLIAAKPDSRFALDPVVIAKEAKTYAKEVVVEKNIRKALKTAYRSSGRTDIICATGSLYTAGEVLRAFPFI
jgi:dihydrofolate synthase/folylpolyglutamate synthase